ncbi:hypothetical protein BDQ17DRAFT_1422984 [Cyathus striatus]|nr:hypothetical protein BDQ17DRAFT_1422984 [Cyathus striatus]
MSNVFPVNKYSARKCRDPVPGETISSLGLLYNLVADLSAGGMSSDETDDDQSEGRKFWIKKHSWRSNALVNYLSIINKDHNFTTAYAEKRPSNPPRARKCRVGATVSTRTAIPGLLRNFYDETWYNSLSSCDKKYLDAQNEIELPEIAQMNH